MKYVPAIKTEDVHAVIDAKIAEIQALLLDEQRAEFRQILLSQWGVLSEIRADIFAKMQVMEVA